jgi:excisionase family DNA binding protein
MVKRMTSALVSGRMITADDVAALLNVSLRQVWRMRAARELPAPVRIGKRAVRWREADIINYLERLA